MTTALAIERRPKPVVICKPACTARSDEHPARGVVGKTVADATAMVALASEKQLDPRANDVMKSPLERTAP